MKRREFTAGIFGAVATWSLAARAQHARKIVRIGVLASLAPPALLKLSQKLNNLGYVEGGDAPVRIPIRRTA
jgi:hypothetical protein